MTLRPDTSPFVRVSWVDETGHHALTKTQASVDAFHCWLLGHRRFVTDWQCGAPRLRPDLKREGELVSFRRPRRAANTSAPPSGSSPGAAA